MFIYGDPSRDDSWCEHKMLTVSDIKKTEALECSSRPFEDMRERQKML